MGGAAQHALHTYYHKASSECTRRKKTRVVKTVEVCVTTIVKKSTETR